MPSSVDVLNALHLVLLSSFVVVTSVSMLLGLISRVRVRRPLLVWRNGPFRGIPLGPSLFLGLVGAGFAAALLTNTSLSLPVWVGYPMGGFFWWLATWLARSVVVTEYGVIHDLSRISTAVAWGQVTDYFVTERDGTPHYAFFFRNDDGRHRLDLPVPEAAADAFDAVVARKLDARFAYAEQEAYDEEPLR